jgi:hypothetical protein
VAKVYIVSFRTHDDRRPSKFIVLADNMKSAIKMIGKRSKALDLFLLKGARSNSERAPPVRVPLEVRMDALAYKFHETHDMKVKDEIERLAREYGKRGEPWVFVAMSTRILVLINPIPAHL